MSAFRRFVDRLQVWLYLGGNAALANFISRWGSPALVPAELPQEERITLPPPASSAYPPAAAGPLKVVHFDPTFNANRDIDVEHDIAWPASKLDVN
jgi:hypothetical protein